tara:strand:+ start:2276 stop:3631 length:1356 start_codon:yes stop_codon:yes gene_type:complete
MQAPISYDKLVQKWAPVLNEETAGPISDHYRKQVTAAVLENQEKAMREEQMASSFGSINEAGSDTSDLGKFDPVLISLVRRAMPNMVAYDVCGVQPMSGPTGLIFAMKSRYKTARGVSVDDEALKNEAITGFSGDSSFTQSASTPPSGIIDSDFDNDADSAHDAERITASNNAGGGMPTIDGENMGGTGSTMAEMGFTIDKQTVTAKTRALKAEYTMELAQDLKAIHGLDAETELANILSAEVLAEINREVIRTINSQAKSGGALTSTGVASADFDLNLDADGRWSVEKFKGLIFQIEKDANQIAKDTRRGKGNFIICSSNVASALAAAGMLDYTPAMSSNLQVDDTGNTFAGVLNGKMKVYVDPYAANDYCTVGYKGANAYDAGVFYCPYVPLTMVRAVGENDFQPKVGFKTRYGMVSNPFVGTNPTNGLATAKSNQYYRIFRVANILGS